MQHRQVPQIAQIRQQISQSTLPPIQSPMGMPSGSYQQSEEAASISETVQDLAMEIYAQLAVTHIQHNPASDERTLRDLAGSAQKAALAYFHSLGVQFQEQQP